jgi:hypothetical protein
MSRLHLQCTPRMPLVIHLHFDRRSQLGLLFELPAPVKIPVRMTHVLPSAEPLAPFDAVRDLKQPRASDVIVSRSCCLYNLALFRDSELVRGQDGGRQSRVGKMPKGTAVRVLGPRRVGRDDTLTTACRSFKNRAQNGKMKKRGRRTTLAGNSCVCLRGRSRDGCCICSPC